MKTRQLLIEEPPMLFSRTLAKAIGLNWAIILQQFYWIENQSSDKFGKVDEGKKWFRFSYEELQKQHFTWMSTRTIRRELQAMEKANLIFSRNDPDNNPNDKYYTTNSGEAGRLICEGNSTSNLSRNERVSYLADGQNVHPISDVEGGQVGHTRVDKLAIRGWTSWPYEGGQVGHTRVDKLAIRVYTENTTENTAKNSTENTPLIPQGGNVEIPKSTLLPASDSNKTEAPARMMKLVKIFTPARPNPMQKKSLVRKFERAAGDVTDEELDTLVWFYGLPKSPDGDKTWNRKTSLPILLNNLDDQIAFAIETKQKKSKAESHTYVPNAAQLEEQRLLEEKRNREDESGFFAVHLKNLQK